MYNYTRKRVAQNSRFDIYFDTIYQVNGSQIEDFLVLTPNSTHPDFAGCKVLLVQNGKFGVFRAHSHVLGHEIYKLAGGFSEPTDSSAVEAARRELSEELGLDCAEIQLRHLGPALPEAGILNGIVELFSCEIAVSTEYTESEDESEFGAGKLVWLDARALYSLCKTSRVSTDLIITFYRYLDANDSITFTEQGSRSTE
jgi:NUDIX domain